MTTHDTNPVQQDATSHMSQSVWSPTASIETISDLVAALDLVGVAGVAADGDLDVGDKYDNVHRAASAAAAFVGYARRTHQLSECDDEEPATVFADFLADLRHLADVLGLDYGERDDHGHRHYTADLYGG